MQSASEAHTTTLGLYYHGLLGNSDVHSTWMLLSHGYEIYLVDAKHVAMFGDTSQCLVTNSCLGI
jgi:hypothetical protein